MCLAFISTFAATSYVELSRGKKLNGEIVMYNDTSVTFKLEGSYQIMTIPVDKLLSGRLEDGSMLMVEDGKIIVRTKEELRYMKDLANYSQMQSPNYAIGKALKSTGAVSLGIGVPVLAAGIATCIAGNVGVTKYDLIERAQCAEASYYLLGTGAAMTIIGIPLYVHGKKMIELHFKYSGNSAGVAVNF